MFEKGALRGSLFNYLVPELVEGSWFDRLTNRLNSGP